MKYKIIEKLLKKNFPIEICEIIWNYLLPKKNKHNFYNMIEPETRYYNRYFNINTQEFDEIYITCYYDNLIIQRCENCSHIIYFKYKKNVLHNRYCKCYTSNYFD